MKTIVQKKVIVIKESNPEAFERALNGCFSRFCEEGIEGYELRFNDSLGLCAYVVYDDVTHVPQTLAEVAEAEGNASTCSECIHFIQSDDLRRKYHMCDYKCSRVKEQTPACEAFYEYDFVNVEKGEA